MTTAQMTKSNDLPHGNANLSACGKQGHILAAGLLSMNGRERAIDL